MGNSVVINVLESSVIRHPSIHNKLKTNFENFNKTYKIPRVCIITVVAESIMQFTGWESTTDIHDIGAYLMTCLSLLPYLKYVYIWWHVFRYCHTWSMCKFESALVLYHRHPWYRCVSDDTSLVIAIPEVCVNLMTLYLPSVSPTCVRILQPFMYRTVIYVMESVLQLLVPALRRLKKYSRTVC